MARNSSVSLSDMRADLLTRLSELRATMAAKTAKLAPLQLDGEFSAEAARARDALLSEMEALKEREASLQSALDEVGRREAAESVAETAEAERQRRERKLSDIRTAHAQIAKAVDDMEAAGATLVKAARTLTGASVVASPGIHEHAAMLPRRILSALAEEMRGAGVQMDNFVIRDAVDHWDHPTADDCFRAMRGKLAGYTP